MTEAMLLRGSKVIPAAERIRVAIHPVPWRCGPSLSDAARLRDVGGFTDVQVEVRKGLAHEGWLPDAPKTKGITRIRMVAFLTARRSNSFKDADTALRRAKSFAKAEKACPDLLFVQRHLPSMVDFSTPAPETC
eukprot:s1701_g14.t1